MIDLPGPALNTRNADAISTEPSTTLIAPAGTSATSSEPDALAATVPSAIGLTTRPTCRTP